MKALFALLPAALLLSCAAASNAPEAAPATATVAAPDETAQPAVVLDAKKLEGTWDNTSCGERKFRRRVELHAQGKLLGTDFIAPCPAGARCVWSGVVGWQGTWSVSNQGLEVSISPLPGEIPGAAALPEGFTILGSSEPIVAERSGAVLCPYQRVR